MNARSLIPKTDELLLHNDVEKTDGIVVTESPHLMTYNEHSMMHCTSLPLVWMTYSLRNQHLLDKYQRVISRFKKNSNLIFGAGILGKINAYTGFHRKVKASHFSSVSQFKIPLITDTVLGTHKLPRVPTICTNINYYLRPTLLGLLLRPVLSTWFT